MVIEAGQIWKENDNRFTRYFKILAVNQKCATVITTDENGKPCGKTSHPSLKRFNDKHQGYSFIKECK